MHLPQFNSIFEFLDLPFLLFECLFALLTRIIQLQLKVLNLELKIHAFSPLRLDFGTTFVFQSFPFLELAKEIGICALQFFIGALQVVPCGYSTVTLKSGPFDLRGQNPIISLEADLDFAKFCDFPLLER
jgi:hypothetical protein